MSADPVRKPTWSELLAAGPVLLPAAHDALTARLIARAGFRAYQVGGFALAGSRYGFPDVDLIHYGEEAAAVRDIIAASPLPVLVDGGDGFGDVKNVTRTVRGYEVLGASAVFIEDQVAPTRCGQMGNKEVVPAEVMVGKVRAAAAARARSGMFLLARTDARGAEGLDAAIGRAGRYLEAGADGAYVEGLRSARELKKVGKALPGAKLATTMMEGGGKLKWVPPDEIFAAGFSMALYPTTVLFRATRAIERALADLKAGRPMAKADAVDLDEFEEVVGMGYWRGVEKRYG